MSLIIDDFLFFLKNTNVSVRCLTLKDRVKVISELYYNLIKATLVIIIISTVIVLFTKSEAFIETTKVVRINNKILYAFLILVVGPIYEEFSYRYFLTKFEKKKFIISSSLILSYYLFVLIKSRLFYIDGVNYLFHYYGYLFIFGMMFYLLLNLVINNNFLLKIRNIWEKHFNIIFYTVSFLFVCNYLIESMFSYLTIEIRCFMLVPLFLYSLMVGYIRIKLNFTYVVIFNILFHLPGVIIKLVFS